MKNKKRAIALLLVLLLGLAAALSACNTNSEEKENTATTYPYVFVHGLNGFGDDKGLPVSYWGSTGGALLPALAKEGFLCVAPTVSAAGSAWDRACELYAAITGTRTDYGAAHSAEHGHERFGRTYETALIPDWGTVDDNGNLRKINIIAHSFGGATARLMGGLLNDGSAAERNIAAKEGGELSPLFMGGKGDWIFSLTCLASPHNGTSLLDMADINPLISSIAGFIGGNAQIDKALSSVGVNFGGKSLGDILEAAKTQDTAYFDLTRDGAAQVSTLSALNPNTYYFSYPVDGTKDGSPTNDMMLPLRVLGAVIGSFTDEAAGIGDEWKANDGLVNTISATAPFSDTKYDIKTAEELTPDFAYQPAGWYVMPTVRGDHGSIIGLGRPQEEIMPLFLDQMRRIDALSKEVTG